MPAGIPNKSVEIDTIHRYLQEWRSNSHNAPQTKELDDGIATAFEIYSLFINNGFKWNECFPTLSANLGYMSETLTASTILSLRIATEGLRYFTAHLAGVQGMGSRARLSELRNLNEFARKLNADFSKQIAEQMQRNRTNTMRLY